MRGEGRTPVAIRAPLQGLFYILYGGGGGQCSPPERRRVSNTLYIEIYQCDSQWAKNYLYIIHPLYVVDGSVYCVGGEGSNSVCDREREKQS